MSYYRKKPVVIEAMQLREGIDPWPIIRWVRKNGGMIGDHPTQRAFLIVTLEGEHIVSMNDWIIKGVKGEFYPCKPDIFAATYEAV